MSTLPAPSPEALAHTQRLTEAIAAESTRADGWLGFARFMELALYAPGLGYYSAGAGKFGGAGDFVTAPELTPLFGQTLARPAAEVLATTNGDILELGAGTGRLALDLLTELARLDTLPERYFILDVSADLRYRQRQLMEQSAPKLLPRVHWIDALPERFTGLILGNEVLDALPAHLVHWREDGLQERGVAWMDNAFVWQDRPLQAGALFEAARALPVSPPYLSEISLAGPAWIRSLATCLERGSLLLIDYGFPQAEYYHPQRHEGTLMCHYRHHSHADPFFLPGLQDITAHVDFSAVAAAGVDAGLDLLGYTSQANFLIQAGIIETLARIPPGGADYFRAAAAVQKLMSPAEMGELFKVIGFGKDLGIAVPGFGHGDRSHSL